MTRPVHELTQPNESFYLKDFFEQIQDLDSNLLPQIIGSIFSTTNFYDKNQENYLSPMTVILLQKFHYLIKFGMYSDDLALKEKAVSLLKDWAKDKVVNDKIIEKYCTSCNELKKQPTKNWSVQSMRWNKN